MKDPKSIKDGLQANKLKQKKNKSSQDRQSIESRADQLSQAQVMNLSHYQVNRVMYFKTRAYLQTYTYLSMRANLSKRPVMKPTSKTQIYITKHKAIKNYFVILVLFIENVQYTYYNEIFHFYLMNKLMWIFSSRVSQLIDVGSVVGFYGDFFT